MQTRQTDEHSQSARLNQDETILRKSKTQHIIQINNKHLINNRNIRTKQTRKQ